MAQDPNDYVPDPKLTNVTVGKIGASVLTIVAVLAVSGINIGIFVTKYVDIVIAREEYKLELLKQGYIFNEETGHYEYMFDKEQTDLEPLKERLNKLEDWSHEPGPGQNTHH